MTQWYDSLHWPEKLGFWAALVGFVGFASLAGGYGYWLGKDHSIKRVQELESENSSLHSRIADLESFGAEMSTPADKPPEKIPITNSSVFLYAQKAEVLFEGKLRLWCESTYASTPAITVTYQESVQRVEIDPSERTTVNFGNATVWIDIVDESGSVTNRFIKLSVTLIEQRRG